MSAALVELIRSGLVDEIHRGDLAVVSADGELRFAVGDPLHKVAFWRSSAKPFQAMPLIASGAAERLGLASEDIALSAASHGGEPVHVDRVASLLERTGHRIEDLECGAHAPLDAEAARDLERHGEAPTALHNNCSGKHAGLLALADQLGAPIAGYRLPGASGATDDPRERRALHRARAARDRARPRRLRGALLRHQHLPHGARVRAAACAGRRDPRGLSRTPQGSCAER